MADQEGERVVVFAAVLVVVDLAELAVEEVAAEAFGVSDLVCGVSVGSEGERGGVEAVAAHTLIQETGRKRIR